MNKQKKLDGQTLSRIFGASLKAHRTPERSHDFIEIVLKFILVIGLSLITEHTYLHKIPAIHSLPAVGYESQQESLQDIFKEQNGKTPVQILDVSSSLPESNKAPYTDSRNLMLSNVRNLGSFIQEVSLWKPKCIIVDLDCSPTKTDLEALPREYESLYKDIDEVISKGVPVVFMIQNVSIDDFKRIESARKIANYAANAFVPDPTIRDYNATAFTKSVDGVPPLCVLAKWYIDHPSSGGMSEAPPSLNGSPNLGDGKDVWVNYEAIGKLITDAYGFNLKNGPFVPKVQAPNKQNEGDLPGKQLAGRVVIIGRLSNPGTDSQMHLPVSENTKEDVANFVKEKVVPALHADESAEAQHTLALNDSTLPFKAGVLFQASYMHTLLGRQLSTPLPILEYLVLFAIIALCIVASHFLQRCVRAVFHLNSTDKRLPGISVVLESIVLIAAYFLFISYGSSLSHQRTLLLTGPLYAYVVIVHIFWGGVVSLRELLKG